MSKQMGKKAYFRGSSSRGCTETSVMKASLAMDTPTGRLRVDHIIMQPRSAVYLQVDGGGD